MKRSTVTTTLVASVMCMLFFCVSAVQAQTYISETFTGTTAPDWTFINAAGDGPVLTAAEGIDSDGSGWLRLTSDKNYQNSFVYYDNPITTEFGLIIEFDFVFWTADKYSIADGFTIALWDGDAAPAAGGWGGSLGYAQHSTSGSIGMNGGFTAFGFDAYGNFSNPIEDRVGGPGLIPHSITIRGPMGADRTQGYEYITGAHDLEPFSSLNARRRRRATVYNVILTMNLAGEVTIQMRGEGGTWQTLLDAYPSFQEYPQRVMIGFTASTGGVTGIQELRNFEVTPIEEPDCWVDDDCPAAEECYGFICEDTSLIELGELYTTWQEDEVAVNWITDTEIDNAYFNVYRAESIKTLKEKKVDKFIKKREKRKAKNKKLKTRWKKGLKKGPYVKINTAPVPAAGESPYGAFYEFIDTDVESGKRYWYKIEDVDLFGLATQHGPCGPLSAWEDEAAYMP